MDHSEKARALFYEGYNCSQAVVCAFEDVTGIDIKTSARLSSSFGGGMGRLREVCGAVSGGLLILGILRGYDDPEDYEAKVSHYQLVQEFDSRIVLSAEKLYERFGLENGKELLTPYFSHIKLFHYEDALVVDKPEPLIEYILSCHGNQNQYILDRYKEFRSFVEKKTVREFTITKDAGLFYCQKPEGKK